MRTLVLALVLGAGGCFGTPQGGGGGGNGGGGGTITPGTADAHQQHNLDVLNMYRAQAGVGALVIDNALNAFSAAAAMDYEQTNQAHRYFMQAGQTGALWQDGFCGSAAENEAPGWPTNGNIDATVDAILDAMMNHDAASGNGHRDNILAASSTRVGIGLLVDAQGGLWLANDFSGTCN